MNLRDKSMPEQVRGLQVSAEYREVFRLRPMLGRGFRFEESQPGNDKVVILTDGLWQRSFGCAKGRVGRSIQLGGESKQLTQGEINCSRPQFSPDGKTLYALAILEGPATYSLTRLARCDWPSGAGFTPITASYCDRKVTV